MPNECTNYITFRFNSENDLHDFERDFENYECFEKKVIRKGTRGIIVTTVTAWKPDVIWLNKILDTYHNSFVKDEWNEEGGLAGVWIGQYSVGGVKIIDGLKWDDLCVEERALYF